MSIGKSGVLSTVMEFVNLIKNLGKPAGPVG